MLRALLNLLPPLVAVSTSLKNIRQERKRRSLRKRARHSQVPRNLPSPAIGSSLELLQSPATSDPSHSSADGYDATAALKDDTPSRSSPPAAAYPPGLHPHSLTEAPAESLESASYTLDALARDCSSGPLSSTSSPNNQACGGEQHCSCPQHSDVCPDIDPHSDARSYQSYLCAFAECEFWRTQHNLRGQVYGCFVSFETWVDQTAQRPAGPAATMPPVWVDDQGDSIEVNLDGYEEADANPFPPQYAYARSADLALDDTRLDSPVPTQPPRSTTRRGSHGIDDDDYGSSSDSSFGSPPDFASPLRTGHLTYRASGPGFIAQHYWCYDSSKPYIYGCALEPVTEERESNYGDSEDLHDSGIEYSDKASAETGDSELSTEVVPSRVVSSDPVKVEETATDFSSEMFSLLEMVTSGPTPPSATAPAEAPAGSRKPSLDVYSDDGDESFYDAPSQLGSPRPDSLLSDDTGYLSADGGSDESVFDAQICHVIGGGSERRASFVSVDSLSYFAADESSRRPSFATDYYEPPLSPLSPRPYIPESDSRRQSIVSVHRPSFTEPQPSTRGRRASVLNEGSHRPSPSVRNEEWRSALVFVEEDWRRPSDSTEDRSRRPSIATTDYDAENETDEPLVSPTTGNMLNFLWAQGEHPALRVDSGSGSALAGPSSPGAMSVPPSPGAMSVMSAARPESVLLPSDGEESKPEARHLRGDVSRRSSAALPDAPCRSSFSLPVRSSSFSALDQYRSSWAAARSSPARASFAEGSTSRPPHPFAQAFLNPWTGHAVDPAEPSATESPEGSEVTELSNASDDSDASYDSDGWDSDEAGWRVEPTIEDYRGLADIWDAQLEHVIGTARLAPATQVYMEIMCASSEAARKYRRGRHRSCRTAVAVPAAEQEDAYPTPPATPAPTA